MTLPDVISFPLSRGFLPADLRAFWDKQAATLGLAPSSYECVSTISDLALSMLSGGRGQNCEIILGRMRQRADIDIFVVDRSRTYNSAAELMSPGSRDPESGFFQSLQEKCNVFDIECDEHLGTLVHAGLSGPQASDSEEHCFKLAGFAVPKHGEQSCGDKVLYRCHESKAVVYMIDALGHGEAAEATAVSAVSIISTCTVEESPAAILQKLHRQMGGTRGAAVSIAIIDSENRTVTWSGIGNVSGTILYEEKSAGCVTLPGILGFQVRSTKDFKYRWDDNSVLVMYTDGLGQAPSRLQLKKDVALSAGIAYRNYGRGTDDTSVSIIRQAETAGRHSWQ